MTETQSKTSRRAVVTGAAGLSLTAALPAAAANHHQTRKESVMTNKPSIVFAHGLWADGSCFQKLIPALQAQGHQVICSQHGLDSLKSDVDCVKRCFGRVSGP